MKRNTDGINYPKEAMMKLQSKILDDMSSGYFATVVAVNPPHVSLQPTAMTKDNKKQAMVNNAWLMIPPLIINDHNGDGENWDDPKTDIKLNIKKGDKVYVAVIDHDTQYYKGQDSMRVADTQPHNVNDSIVLGKIAEVGDFK